MASEDTWKSEFPHDYAHAVGVFALSYNALEMAVYGFFQRYAPGAVEAQSFLYAALHNQARRQFVISVSPHRDSIAASGAVLHAMKCFDVCSENRNLLLHATPFMFDEADSSEPFTMGKIRKDTPHLIALYDFSLADVRGAADGASAVEAYVLGLLRYSQDWDAMNALTSEFPELPPQPPLPRKLSLSRRPTAPAAD
jgi:hypothetical protein